MRLTLLPAESRGGHVYIKYQEGLGERVEEPVDILEGLPLGLEIQGAVRVGKQWENFFLGLLRAEAPSI